ncbi:hypothetical protein STEG23_030697, partial [Scotinomys teguina]
MKKENSKKNSECSIKIYGCLPIHVYASHAGLVPLEARRCQIPITGAKDDEAATDTLVSRKCLDSTTGLSVGRAVPRSHFPIAAKGPHDQGNLQKKELTGGLWFQRTGHKNTITPDKDNKLSPLDQTAPEMNSGNRAAVKGDTINSSADDPLPRGLQTHNKHSIELEAQTSLCHSGLLKSLDHEAKEGMTGNR